YVSVKSLDDVAALLLHDAPLKLQREGQAPVVEREIVGQQRKTLDGFVLREVRGEPAHFAIDEIPRQRMSGQLGVGRGVDVLFCGFGGNGGGIGNNQRGNEFAAIADDHGIQNIRTGLQRIFNRLWSDKFPGGGLQQVLLAIGDEKIVV